MPKFFLHIRETDNYARDEEGIDVPDLTAAMDEAIEGAREILADAVRAHKLVDGRTIEIADESGSIVGTVRLRDMLDK